MKMLIIGASVLVLSLAACATAGASDEYGRDDHATLLPPPDEAVPAPPPDQLPPPPDDSAAPPPGIALTPQELQQGFFVITQQYTGDVDSTTGNVKTYGVSSVEVRPSSYGIVRDIVATGQPGAFDGRTVNGRAVRADGQAVAGMVVESFVRNQTTGQMESIGFTFLQSDAESLAAPVAAPVVEPLFAGQPQVPAAEPFRPVAGLPEITAPDMSVAGAEPALDQGDVSSLEPVTVIVEGDDIDRPVEREPLPRPAIPPVKLEPSSPSSPSSPSAPPATQAVRAYVALAPQGDALGQIEVLRGRRAELWIRGTADGHPARVVSWRLVLGEVTALGPVAGAGDDPFVAEWLAVGGPSPFALTFEAFVEAGGTSRPATATITVIVRSPALVE